MSDFATSQERTARKEHRCCECRSAIVPGTRYRCGVSVVDGRADTWRMCLPCNALSEFAWNIMRREKMHLEDGPVLGDLAVWLADYERPEILSAEMTADVAAHFAALLARKGMRQPAE